MTDKEYRNKVVVRRNWDADVVDTGHIHDEFNKMWAEVTPTRIVSGPYGEERLTGHNAPDIMRANTLNLVSVADSLEIAGMILQTISQLKDFIPSRTIIIINDPNLERPKTWHIDLQINETLTKDDSHGIQFETITIWTDQSSAGVLSSIVGPLLVAELPTFLWWPSGEFSHNAIFDDLALIADRLVFDSARLGYDAHAVADYRTLIDEPTDPIIGDFTWLRLAPWRQLIAQFFDPLATQKSLESIDSVSIAYAQDRQDHGSGFAAALLTLGWIGSRLGWEVIEPLEARKVGGWTAFMAATDSSGRAHEVQIRLTPDSTPGAKFSLRSVEIVTNDGTAGHYVIQRTDQDDLVTSSETATTPYVSRMVFSRRHSTVEMLGQELQRFGPDRVFEESIRLATQLLPE
ncbi:MAG: glucose-6-phosphate dehydrogenase assembly protein OpcA [Thermomicrobiales bacterium]|nr:glucose-6-phosphate dehydrogenase assembly protein OpcA [Thermomicrobiales bacterium]MCO5224688.1 glucose-6-phosphate dehydrogenase assembly protein OpcA [Thermomicrobiales bacterium]MCO5226656.1 glucose-6-phosphate dehydrogenase assembly protein OpcA [Thermomicrobiales bacterium]